MLLLNSATQYINQRELSPQWIGSVLGMQKMLSKLPSSMLPSNMRELLQNLATMATSGNLQSESLLLCLDTMITFIRKIETSSLDTNTVNGLIQCSLKLWQTYSKDSYINGYVLDILQTIVTHPTEEILAIACKEGVPIIQQVLLEPELESEKATALELLSILISASSKHPCPINEQGSILANLLQACFPTVSELLLNIPISADLIIESGIKCIFSIFNNGLTPHKVSDDKELTSLTESQVSQLIQPSLQFISRLLGDSVSDIACIEIGPLICILLIRCGSLFLSNAEMFFSLLDTVARRVQKAQLFTVQQGLLSVIARLICMNTDAATQNLQSNGHFNAIIQFWIKEYPQFCEEYLGKLSLIAFHKLLLSPVSQQLLGNITIPVQTERASRRNLRSSTGKGNTGDQWKQVPSPNRLVQLIVGEFVLSCVDDDGLGDEDDFDDYCDSDEGSYNEDNEWDPLGCDEEDEFNYCGVDDLLGQDDDETGEGLSVVLTKCDPLTITSTKVSFFKSNIFNIILIINF